MQNYSVNSKNQKYFLFSFSSLAVTLMYCNESVSNVSNVSTGLNVKTNKSRGSRGETVESELP